MKKIISVFLLVILSLTFASGCKSEQTANGKINIVTTIFPEYDWVMQILGEEKNRADVTMLLDNGVDLHSYQPSADDIIKISTCDLFIYVGGTSDEWVEDALKESLNKDMVVINLLDTLGDQVKQEQFVEGMEPEQEEDSDGPEYDEHIWLSLHNASFICQTIADKLSLIDPDAKDTYQANVSAYLSKIDSLDQRYRAATSNAKQKTLLFADRFPFRYLTDDYALTYYAAFIGCSAESEASFETIKFLADKVDELSLPAILTIEGTKHNIAETILKTSKSKNVSILEINSMQSTTKDDVQNGADYLTIMEKNLDVLCAALK